MSDVQFNEPDYNAARSGQVRTKQVSLFSRLIIGMGLATDEASAQKVMLIIAGIIIAVAIGIYAYAQVATSKGKYIPPNPPATNTP